MCIALLYFGLVTTSTVAREIDLLEDSTLTTALLRESTSPKPTTVYRRINVQKDYGEATTTRLDLYEYLDSRRKKDSKRGYIWKWDHWCQLQPKKGECEKKLNKYYYDSQLDQCFPFVYSGCDGNKNNFETLLDCERYCKGANFMKTEEFSKPTFCYLQPDTGLCLALLTKYYFDINERSCKQFTYGGCGGNQNKFDTMLSCMRTCKGLAS